MGSGGGLFDDLKDLVTANQQRKADAKTLKETKQSRQQGLDLVANQDWEPDLSSDHIAPYQRSQSPVADAFLESMLTGQNPAAVQSTRLGSDRAKAAATQGFNQSYGGFDALRQRQQAVREATPWAVKPFDQPAITEADRRGVQAPGLAKFNITPEDEAALGEFGIKLDPVHGVPVSQKNGAPIARTAMIGGAAASPDLYKRIATALRSGDTEQAKRLYLGVG